MVGIAGLQGHPGRTQADDLFAWLKENQYQYAGDEETLGFYIKKAWFFTVMKIDAKQMKPARTAPSTARSRPPGSSSPATSWCTRCG